MRGFGTGPRAEAAEILARAVVAAGPVVREVYARGDARADPKADGSPVTEADLRAQEQILAVLASAMPGVRVIGEEDEGERAPLDPAGLFVLVDPLDGTREFLSRNGEFTINAALIEGGRPVAGAVLAPALGRLWVGGSAAARFDGVEAVLPPLAQGRPIRTRPAPLRLTALASRSHLDPATQAFLDRLPIGDRRSAGSSLKFCVVAEGEADVYPRFGPTMEWDTAAGHAVLLAAGGVVLEPGGGPFSYGKVAAGYRNGSFIAWGDPTAATGAPLEKPAALP